MKCNTDPATRPTRSLVLAVLAVAGALALPARAAAHDLRAEVPHPETDPVRVEAGYDDGTPAGEARVTVTDAAGAVVAAGKTDERGVWEFPKPGPGTYRIVVEAAGHRDAVRLTIPEGPGAVPTVFTRERLDKTFGVAIGLALLLGGTLAFVLLRRRKRPGGRADHPTRPV